MAQSNDSHRMLGHSSETTYIPMYTTRQPHHRNHPALYVIKRDSKVETTYVSHIGTRRNYTSELVFALTFSSKSDAERAATRDETVCLLSEESLYQ